MKTLPSLFALGLGLAATLAQAAPDAVLRVEASEPRAYGYQVGDHVQRHVVVHVPDGWRLDDATLPRPGGRGQALELRQVLRRTAAGGQRLELDLDYQVFLAPANVRTVEIAPLRLRFAGASRNEEVLVEAWPITIAPLVPVQPPNRRGFGELQPDKPPLPIDTGAARRRWSPWRWWRRCCSPGWPWFTSGRRGRRRASGRSAWPGAACAGSPRTLPMRRGARPACNCTRR